MDGNLSAAKSVVEFAAQTGRLDLISLLLAILGILIGLGAIYGFVHFRNVAKEQAIKVAKETSEEVAEKIANKYIQENLLDILKANAHLFDSSVDDNEANQIADAQENEV